MFLQFTRKIYAVWIIWCRCIRRNVISALFMSFYLYRSLKQRWTLSVCSNALIVQFCFTKLRFSVLERVSGKQRFMYFPQNEITFRVFVKLVKNHKLQFNSIHTYSLNYKYKAPSIYCIFLIIKIKSKLTKYKHYYKDKYYF